MKISVITVSYNACLYIEETIKSVIGQRYDSFEYIIVDGNSSDGTVNVIRNYQDKISQWISEPDKGIYNAMNKAVRMASGEYCIFMNAGDVFLDPLVLKQVSFFLEDGFDYLLGNEISIKNGKIVDYVCAPPKITTELLVRKSLSHQASFIKRKLLLEYPYDEALRMVSDWKFCIQTLLQGNATYRAIDVDVCKFNHEGMTFKNMHLGRKERMEVLQDLLPHETINIKQRTLLRRLQRRIIRGGMLRNSVLARLREKWRTCYSIVIVLKLRAIPVIIGKVLGNRIGFKIKHDAITEFLDKKYAHVIHDNLEVENEMVQIRGKYPVWVCWWQGEKFMPLIPKVCLLTLRRNMREDQCLHVISKDNFSRYVQLPQYVLRKLEAGHISITNFSDILRFALLTKYGGLWIDSTCLVTHSLPNLSDCVFFTSKQQKMYDDNRFVSHYRWASYLVGGKSLCIFKNMRDLFYEYVRREKYVLDYLLLDYLLVEIYTKSENARFIIDYFPYDKYDILDLAQQLDREYKEDLYYMLMDAGNIHKLNRKKKYPIFTSAGKLTIWGAIIDKL